MRKILPLLAAVLGSSPAVAAHYVYGLVGNESIAVFDAANPSTAIANRAITGLVAGEVLTGIDFRPLDGLIYSIGTSGNVYRFNQAGNSYAATITGLVTTFPFPGSPVPIAGNSFGFDFAPFDRIRLTSDLGQNLRVNPVNGGAAIDPPISATYDIVGAAFANGSPPGAPYFVIDALSSQMLRSVLGIGLLPTDPFGNPYDPLGISLGAGAEVGFDILFAGGINRGFLSAGNRLYGLDVGTGRASLIGNFGIANVRDITVAAAVPEPASWAMMIAGFGAIGMTLRHRRLAAMPVIRRRMAGA